MAPSDDTSAVQGGTSADGRLDSAPFSAIEPTPRPNTLGPWLDAQQQLHNTIQRRTNYTGIIKQPSFEVRSVSSVPRVPKLPIGGSTDLTNSSLLSPLTKEELALQAFTSLVTSSLNPSARQLSEYERYVTHPSKIPLITTSATDYSSAPHEYLEYLSKTTSSQNIAEAYPPNSILRQYDDERGAVTLTMDEKAKASLEEYWEYIESGKVEEPLRVTEEEEMGGKKRYKAYRKWLRGKSLFKQKPVVGEEMEGIGVDGRGVL